MSEKEVTKEKMLILLDRLPQLVAAVYEGHWGNQEQLTYMAIRRLIEKVFEWKDTIESITLNKVEKDEKDCNQLIYLLLCEIRDFGKEAADE
jgi:hypothetical protein